MEKQQIHISHDQVCKGSILPEILRLIQHPYTQQFQQIPTAKSRGISVVSCSYNTYQER